MSRRTIGVGFLVAGGGLSCCIGGAVGVGLEGCCCVTGVIGTLGTSEVDVLGVRSGGKSEFMIGEAALAATFLLLIIVEHEESSESFWRTLFFLRTFLLGLDGMDEMITRSTGFIVSLRPCCSSWVR